MSPWQILSALNPGSRILWSWRQRESDWQQWDWNAGDEPIFDSCLRFSKHINYTLKAIDQGRGYDFVICVIYSHDPCAGDQGVCDLIWIFTHPKQRISFLYSQQTFVNGRNLIKWPISSEPLLTSVWCAFHTTDACSSLGLFFTGKETLLNIPEALLDLYWITIIFRLWSSQAVQNFSGVKIYPLDLRR